MNIPELIVGIFTPAVKTVVKEGLKASLEKLYVQNPQAYKTAIISIYRPIVIHLQSLVDKTKTKIDDAGVDGIQEAIEESAAEHGVTLPTVEQLRMEEVPPNNIDI